MTAEEKLEKFINRLVKLSDYFLEKEKKIMFSSVQGVHPFVVVTIPDTIEEALESVRSADESVLNVNVQALRKVFSEAENNTSRVINLTLKELVEKLAESSRENS